MKLFCRVPTKDQEEDDGKKTKDDLKGDENDDWSLTKYEGEALSIGKKPDTRIIFDGLKSDTDTNITVSSLATDKYGKPKHAKAKAYENALYAKIIGEEYFGTVVKFTLESEDGRLLEVIQPVGRYSGGNKAVLGWNGADTHLLPWQTDNV